MTAPWGFSGTHKVLVARDTKQTVTTQMRTVQSEKEERTARIQRVFSEGLSEQGRLPESWWKHTGTGIHEKGPRLAGSERAGTDQLEFQQSPSY